MFATKLFIQEKLESPDAILGLFGAAGISSPAKDTVRKWFERGSIPSEWWPIVLVVLELTNGGPVSLAGYAGNKATDHDIFG